MKTNKWRMLAVLCVPTLFLTAFQCGTDEREDVDIVTPKNVKEYLQETGLEFAGKIDAEDHRSTCKLLSELIEKYEGYDEEAFEDYMDDLSTEFGFEEKEEYYDYAPQRILEPVVEYLQGTSGRYTLTRAGQDIVKHSIAMPKLYGKFTASDDRETFKFDNSVKDRLEVVLYDKNGKAVTVTLKGSSKTTSLKCIVTETDNDYHGSSLYESDSETHELLIDVPSEITMTITHNGSTLLEANVMTKLNINAQVEQEYNDYYTYSSYWQGWSWDESDDLLTNLKVDFTNVNLSTSIEVDGYEASATTQLTQKALSFENSLSVNGTFMYLAKLQVNGDFSDLDETVMDAVEEESDRGVSDYLSKLGLNASLSVNVLDRVKVEASASSLSKLYDAIKALEQATDDGSKSAIDMAVKKVNNLFESGLYLNGSSKKTAYVELDSFKEDDYDDVYYYVEPILVFGYDESSYRFEEYFTENSFEELIDACAELEDDFEDMLNRYFD